MNKVTKILYSILIPAVIIVLAVNLIGLERNLSIAENDNSFTDRESRTEGNVDFQIATTSYGGEYEPEHVLAIWVTDENDQFVRTLVRRAWDEIEDLVKWNNMTGGNYQNAIVTGATINNHTTHNISWDCTDNLLFPIPDGVYRIYAEFSEDDTNTGGPWTMVEFTKGSDPVALAPASGNNFHDIELYFTPVVPPDPTIEITSPANNSIIENLPFNVEFTVENFDPTAGDGLIGYLLNGTIVQMYTTLEPITIDDLAAGTNEITLMLYDEFGAPLDPEISDAVNVIYEPNQTGEVVVQSSRLLGNYPNPFNPETTISFNITENEVGTLSIYNLKGQRILKKQFEAGGHQFLWKAVGHASGIYFYKLSSPTINTTRKMIMMK